MLKFIVNANSSEAKAKQYTFCYSYTDSIFREKEEVSVKGLKERKRKKQELNVRISDFNLLQVRSYTSISHIAHWTSYTRMLLLQKMAFCELRKYSVQQVGSVNNKIQYIILQQFQHFVIALISFWRVVNLLRQCSYTT